MKKIFVYLKDGHTWYGANDKSTNYNEDDNLITFNETDEVSLKGSPTVSPTTEASCKRLVLSLKSTSTTFLALSHAPPAFAI